MAELLDRAYTLAGIKANLNNIANKLLNDDKLYSQVLSDYINSGGTKEEFVKAISEGIRVEPNYSAISFGVEGDDDDDNKTTQETKEETKQDTKETKKQKRQKRRKKIKKFFQNLVGAISKVSPIMEQVIKSANNKDKNNLSQDLSKNKEQDEQQEPAPRPKPDKSKNIIYVGLALATIGIIGYFAIKKKE